MKIKHLALLFALGMFALGCSREVTEQVAVAPYDSAGPQTQEFEKPYRIFANAEAIDTDVGHAAPLVADYDGDGVNDLLVGQFGDGILKIYRNIGSNSQPKYTACVEFMDGSDGAGRIPTA